MSTDFPDYPAAHSMDTTWWAVDSQGHVAQFNSHEAGAVPETAGEPLHSLEMFYRLVQAGFAGTTLFVDDVFQQPDGRLLYRQWDQPWQVVARELPEAPPDAERASGYMLWLRDEAAIATLRERLAPPTAAKSILQRVASALTAAVPPPSSPWRVTRLPAQGKTVVWVDSAEDGGPPVQHVRRLLEEGIVLRGIMYQLWTLDMERLGFFVYEHERFDNWIAGPYERSVPPAHPVRFTELPPAIREVIGSCRLAEIDYRREPLVQPFDLGGAHTWNEEWVSATGRRRRTDEGGVPPGRSPVPYPLATGNWQSNLAPLLAIYLREELGAEAVLNDYLEETGQAPLPAEPGTDKRLETMLLRFLTPQELLTWEAESLEHWLESDAPPQGAAAVRTAIQASKESAAGRAASSALEDAANQAFAQWSDMDDEMTQPGSENRMAWAAWALTSRLPLVATRTAREVRPQELAWQIEHALVRLDQKFCGES